MSQKPTYEKLVHSESCSGNSRNLDLAWLSVSHRIIEEHGGSIMAENSPEGGVAFTINLPVKRTKG